MQKRPYTFVVLRYRPDITLDEFINAGVVVFDAETQRGYSRFCLDGTRAKAAFPQVNAELYSALVHQLADRLPVVACTEHFHRNLKDAFSYACTVLPQDDSAFYWSPLMGGLTHDVEATRDRLFTRYTHTLLG